MPTTRYVWDGDHIITEKDENGVTLVEYTWEPEMPGEPPRLISAHRGGTTYYYHYDGQGNTRAITNDAGEITDEYTYSAFGETNAQSGTTPNPFRFGGEHGYYTDAERSNLFVGRRIYSPALSRWLSVDPLRAGIALYRGYDFSRILLRTTSIPAGLRPERRKFC